MYHFILITTDFNKLQQFVGNDTVIDIQTNVDDLNKIITKHYFENILICFQAMVEVVWDVNETTDYPYVWLRDSCLCDKCYLPTSKSRLLMMKNLDINATATHAKVQNLVNGNKCIKLEKFVFNATY